MNKTNNNSRTTEIYSVPCRTEPFGGIGWTVCRFASAEAAATFVTQNPAAAMPCWRRFSIVDGRLVIQEPSRIAAA